MIKEKHKKIVPALILFLSITLFAGAGCSLQPQGNGPISKLTAKGKTDASQPMQTTMGYGSAAYLHSAVKKARFGSGNEEYWIFEPESPSPQTAPVVIFNHGWGAMNPGIYGGWVEHLVKRGNIVIYPRYQENLRTSPTLFTDNALTAIKNAFEELGSDDHVRPDYKKVAVIGHSIGGIVSVNIAARMTSLGIPKAKAVMSIQPGKTWSHIERVNMPLEDLSTIPTELLLLVVVGDKDMIVKDIDAQKIFYQTTTIPLKNKDFITVQSDDHGTPPLVANHGSPASFLKTLDVAQDSQPSFEPSFRERLGTRIRSRLKNRVQEKLEDVVTSEEGVPIITAENATTNALDYYGYWRLFDALMNAAFTGTDRDAALGNTEKQRFMGIWSDGTPVSELMVTDTP